MGKWIIKHVIFFIFRCVATCLLIYAIQNLIHKEGYFISFQVLLACAITIIIGVGMWVKPLSKED